MLSWPCWRQAWITWTIRQHFWAALIHLCKMTSHSHKCTFNFHVPQHLWLKTKQHNMNIQKHCFCSAGRFQYNYDSISFVAMDLIQTVHPVLISGDNISSKEDQSSRKFVLLILPTYPRWRAARNFYIMLIIRLDQATLQIANAKPCHSLLKGH